MAKLLLLVSLSVLCLILINHGSSAADYSDQREAKYNAMDRRINEMRLDFDDDESEYQNEEDDVIDAKELNQRLEVVHKKPDYDIFDENVAKTLIAEADKAVAKINVIIENNKDDQDSVQEDENKGYSRRRRRRRRRQCHGFRRYRQTFMSLLTNYTTVKTAIATAKQTKNDALIRYKVYYNLHQRFCINSTTTICSYINTSKTTEDTNYNNAIATIKALTKKLLEYGIKLLNIGESIAKCFGH